MTTINIADAVATFSTTLTEQRNELIAQLEKLDNERAEVVKSMGVIDRTLAALTGKPMPTEQADGSTGKKWKMSPEGRARISAALQARSARLRAEKEEAGGKGAEAVTVPSAAVEEQSAPVQEAVPTVKVTELEKDVLAGGILQNNFRDGANGEQSIWVDQIIANGACKLVTAKQLPGVVASLSKKKLVSTDGEGITLTETGLALARGLVNG